jgi:hypothetical protein
LLFRSCVNLGLYDDDFVKFFVAQPVRRPPLINRGTDCFAWLPFVLDTLFFHNSPHLHASLH